MLIANVMINIRREIVEQMQTRRIIRGGHVLIGGVMLFLAVAFLARWPFAMGLWPWAGAYSLTGLSPIFIASILAAIGAPVIWIGLSGHVGAGEAGSINLSVTFIGLTVFMLQSHAASGNPRLLIAAIVCALSVIALIVAFLTARRYPLANGDPTPMPLRLAFAFFSVALVVVGPLLLLKRPNIFPWPLSAEASVVYGWIFLGAATYFIHGLFRPVWHNAAGQLIGFLAYDLVLIGPFIALFGRVSPANRPSLIVYTTVLLFSGAVAIYYLVINRETRLWHPVPSHAT
jgi:hypothetical protein